jgi:hypothetical protein
MTMLEARIVRGLKAFDDGAAAREHVAATERVRA